MTRKLTFLILALFALISGPGWGQQSTYTKVTSTNDLTSGDTYLIVYEASSTEGRIFNGLDAANDYVTASISNSNIANVPEGSCPVIISSMTGGYSIYLTSGDKEGNYIYGKSGSNSIQYGATAVANVITFNDGLAVIESNSTSFRYNSATNNDRFRYYKTTTTGNTYIYPALYKLQAPSTNPVINAEDVELAYDATSGEISYSITNPNPEASFGAETSALWISHLEITDDKVTFDTEVNTTAASRTATITLNYTGAVEKVVNVTQAGDPSQISYAIDFESEASAYTEWEFTNMESLHNEDIDAYEGEYFGTTGGKASASITTKNKVATPGTLTCWVSKTSTNTTASTWAIQVSSDKSTWTDVKTQSATSMNKGEWVEFSADLSDYTDVYVRVYYSGSTAKRAIDALDITKPSSVATPTFSLAAGTYYEAKTVTLECENEGAAIYYTLDGSTPDNESTPYSGAINISETTTIKAIAYVGNEASNVATAVYTIIPTYASLAELVAAGTPTATGETVRVTITDEVITDFYTSGNYTNGIFLQVGDQEIEIYCRNVPENWIVGGTVSGTLTCPWILYGETETWELCPENWEDLTYVSPSFAINIDEDLENGTIEATPTTATAGTEISFSVTPDEGYRMTAESLIVMDATGEEVEISGNNPYTFTMPNSDVTISAEFELLPTTTYQYLYSVNGISGDELEAYEGESITLATGEDLNDDFTFAGWTTDENDVENILDANSSYTINDDVIFFAVYAREEGGSGATTWNLVTDASQISSGDIIKIAATASDASNPDNNGTFAADGIISSSIMGKVNASINNNQLTDEGAAEFTIGGTASEWTLSNGNGELLGATAAKKIAWDGGTTTWTISINNDAKASISNTETAYGTILYNRDSPRFTTYTTTPNAAMVLPQIFVKTVSTVTRYYTRVFDEDTELASLTVAGPSIILSGKTLTVTGTMSNTNPANLIIEDGAQLFQNSSNVMATVQKNITGYTGDNDNYYLIANPTDNDVVANLTSNEYDLYSFDPCGDKDGYEWINEEGEEVFVKPYSNEDGSAVAVGYLYANSEDVTLEFAGVLNPAGSTDIELTYAEEGEGRDFPGFNLIGNPYACDAYVNGYNFYTMADGEFVINEGSATVAPCEGFFVEATEANQSVTVSTAAPVTAPNALSLNVSQNRGNVIDRAIVRFDGANDLHKFMLNPAHTNLSIAKGGETFAAISTEAEGELPVNFKAEKNGTYTITVNTKNVDAEYLHLIDNMTGMDVDLLSTPSYTFEAKTTDYASRFKLVFGVNNTDSESSDSNFAYMSDGNLVISDIEGEATLQIVDELGRIISTETVSGSYNKTLNLKAGLYILNLNGMTQKIVVE